MAIHKITYSDMFKRANIYNYGCNFNCAWCSYKLKDNGKPTKFLSVDRIKKVLRGLDIERVHFVGGEPTTCSDLAEIADFARNELGAFTKIGHATGYYPPPANIDAMSVSIKTLSDDVHVKYTGVSNASVLKNFADTYERGIKIDASSVLTPGLIDADEIENIARFIAAIDPDIPYHVTGYVPVPNAPWRKPTLDEMRTAVKNAKKYLTHVTFSCLSVQDFFNLSTTDIRYKSVRVV